MPANPDRDEMIAVRYFVTTHTICDRCNGTGEVPNTGFKAITWPNSKGNCWKCHTRGYLVGQVEIDPSSIVLKEPE